ncbi:Uncharacterised protein [Mycobacteroides abscessus subsp. massiliense]|nr:Uncharacterised protein [Mycobacteroides abscessus subsp. massiliense]
MRTIETPQLAVAASVFTEMAQAVMPGQREWFVVAACTHHQRDIAMPVTQTELGSLQRGDCRRFALDQRCAIPAELMDDAYQRERVVVKGMNDGERIKPSVHE